MRKLLSLLSMLTLLITLCLPDPTFGQEPTSTPANEPDADATHVYLPLVQGVGEAAQTEDNEAEAVDAAGVPLQPEVTEAIQFDTSPPLRDLLTTQRAQTQVTQRTNRFFRPPAKAAPAAAGALDTAVQRVAGAALPTTDLLNFAGVGYGDGFTPFYVPPDTNLAVGATQVVQAVNAPIAIFNKADGALLLGPFDMNTVFAGFGGLCETHNDGDQIVQYDKAAQRWLLTQFALDFDNDVYLECVAVSTSEDATGAYHRYAFRYQDFNDYPKIGVWPNGYYVTYNMFQVDDNGEEVLGARFCAWDRSQMLRGRRAREICFQLGSDVFGALPADFDGAPPPAGTPNFFVAQLTNDSLGFWKFRANFAEPARSRLSGPRRLPVAPFLPACADVYFCVPQPNTDQGLDSIYDVVMYRLAYRRFADHESLLVNHTVEADTAAAAIRWYELRNLREHTVVYQQGTYAPDDVSRWMASMAMDKQGNLAIGYSASSSQLHPSIRYTGRLADDPLGTLRDEKSIIEGSGSQPYFLGDITWGRWGDYSALVIDPTDDCTFWYTNEYLKSYGIGNWSTRIASFKFSTCQ